MQTTLTALWSVPLAAHAAAIDSVTSPTALRSRVDLERTSVAVGRSRPYASTTVDRIAFSSMSIATPRTEAARMA